MFTFTTVQSAADLTASSFSHNQTLEKYDVQLNSIYNHQTVKVQNEISGV